MRITLAPPEKRGSGSTPRSLHRSLQRLPFGNADEQAVSLDVAKAAGFYPADYKLPPCPVHRQLVEGDLVQVGESLAPDMGNAWPCRWSSELYHAGKRPHLS